jgi:hypothetical protein
MKIPLPNRLLDWLECHFAPLGDWLNKKLFLIGRTEIRLSDLLLTFFFFVCVGYYYFTDGWIAAAQGGALYIFIAMVALWFL